MIMPAVKKYDTNLSKGAGLIDETLTLLTIYEQGMSKEDFYVKVLQYDLLAKSTENRAQDIVKRVFFRRFWRDKKFDPVYHLKALREKHVSLNVIRQILLIYTCRVNPILQDFIQEVYHSSVAKGYNKLTIADYQDFIKEAIKEGIIDPPWAESMIARVGRYLNAALVDFGLIDKEKNIRPFQVYDETVFYLAHELHFRGYTDDQILHHPDWQIFGLSPDKIVAILNRISWQGHFIVQYSGELLRVSWKYDSMEKAIDGLHN
jgi:hypothetical protein